MNSAATSACLWPSSILHFPHFGGRLLNAGNKTFSKAIRIDQAMAARLRVEDMQYRLLEAATDIYILYKAARCDRKRQARASGNPGLL